MADFNPIHYDVIPKRVKKLWDIWNIRAAVLFSLFLQIVLILSAPNRKRSSSKKLAFIIWSGYLLADATANFAVGLICSNQSSNLSDDDSDLITFWSLFLLVHLGGPDTITALALQDNELWLRHFLTLVFQAVATLYVFLQSLPTNKLMIPMILMFVSGCIKYLERTMSLYIAGRHTFPDFASSSYEESRTEDESTIENTFRQFDDLQLVHKAYRLFGIFEGQIVDQIFSFIGQQKHESMDDITVAGTTALRVIEVELNFLYDILFTKAMVMHSFMGFFFRFFSFCCLITSLVVFSFHITKHGVFNEINVAVTYVLFLGAVALEIIAFLMAVLSDWTVVAIIESEKSSHQSWWRRIVARLSNFVRPAFCKIWSYWKPRWYPEEGDQPDDQEGDQPEDQEGSEDQEVFQLNYQELRTPLLFRRWSGCLSGHNLIRYCLKGQPSGIHNRRSNLCVPIVKAISYAQLDWVIDGIGLRDLLDEMTCLSREPLSKSLWYLIFSQLLVKYDFPNEYMTARQIISSKGEWVLQRSFYSDDELRINLERYIGVPYDESLVLWHVATELLYNDYHNPGKVFPKNNSDRNCGGFLEMSKTLSDYMMYLLIMQPDIMAPVGGATGKTRFQDTCASVKRFFVQKNLGPSQQVEACNYILEADDRTLNSVGENRRSVLFKASMLAKVLRQAEKKWSFICEVWVELLCYAAVHCRGRALEQQLSKGGELVAFVWVLMSHFGMRTD